MEYLDIRRKVIVPNVTTSSCLVGFEADLLVLTSSGYASAIEIKVSASDLKNDLKKKHIVKLSDEKYKQSILQSYYRDLKHFYYAVPEYLHEAALKQIPDFCGLYVVSKRKSRYGLDYEDVNLERKPKVLFAKKWNEKKRLELARLGAMRILNLKRNILHQKQTK